MGTPDGWQVEGAHAVTERRGEGDVLGDPNGDEAGREGPLRDPHATRDGDEARKQGHDLVDDDHVGEVDLLVEGAQHRSRW